MKKTMLKSLMAGLLAVTAMTAVAEEGYKLYFEDFEIAPGETKVVDLMMDNAEPLYILQFDMFLPEGLSINLIAGSEGHMSYGPKKKDARTNRWYQWNEEDEEYAYTHDVVCEYYEDTRNLKTVMMNITKVPFAGLSGAMLHVTFNAAADFAGGKITFQEVKSVSPTDNTHVLDAPDCVVSVPIAATALADVVANGVDGTEYTIAEGLHVVAKAPKAGCVFVSDGQGNWMKVAAEGEVYNAIAAMDDIKAGTLVGTLSDANKNQTLTVTAAPTEATDPVTAEIVGWKLAQSDPSSPMYKFAPKVNEVINLTGYYFSDDNAFRGYPTAPRGQSATVNMEWCNSGELTDATHYVDVMCAVQLKEAWEAEESGAPARVKASDELSFQNYLVYPLEVSDDNVLTGVENLNMGKDVVSVQYINVAGQTSSTPFNGVNMVVTRYADGSQVTSKVIK